MIKGLGTRGSGSGFTVENFGFRVSGLSFLFRVRVEDTGYGLGVQDLGIGVSGLRFTLKVQGEG